MSDKLQDDIHPRLSQEETAQRTNSVPCTQKDDMEPSTPSLGSLAELHRQSSESFQTAPIPQFVPPTHHSSLRRALVPTYKGRVLREDMSTGEARYIDDAAVFVGRLIKAAETRETLFRRFERYGKIVRFCKIT